MKIEQAIENYQELKEHKRGDQHMNGFESVFEELLPAGYTLEGNKKVRENDYRNKCWDYSVFRDGDLAGVIELKSLHKSAGKNLNNRLEEAAGCAAIIKSGRPEVKRSYFIILDNIGSTLQDRMEKFLQDCKSQEWYNSVSALVLNDGDEPRFLNGMSIQDMFKIYQ